MATARVAFRVTVRPGAGGAGAGPGASSDAAAAVVLSGDAPELGDLDPSRAVPLVRVDAGADTGAVPRGGAVWATHRPVTLRRGVPVRYA